MEQARQKPSETTVALELIDLLVARGVRYIFVGPATNHQFAFLDALYERSAQISAILVRHEAMAPLMAEGWFRATGEPGVFHVGAGPALANAVVGVMSAYTCGSAIIGISGQVHSDFWGRNGMQELQSKTWAEGHRILEPTLKRYWQVTNPRKISEVVNQAFSAATTGRPGPVLIDVPMDLWEMPIEIDPVSAGNHLPTGRPAGAREALDRAVDLLQSAQRPVILAGGGVLVSRASTQLVRLAERVGAAVVTTVNGKSSIAADHPLAAGPIAAVGTTGAFETVREADLVLALGTRFHEWVTSGWEPGLPFAFPPARLIQVDIEPQEIGRYYPVEVGIQGDIREVLDGLLERLDERHVTSDFASSPRALALSERRERQVAAICRFADSSAVPIRPERILVALRSALPRDAILLPDAGNNGSLFDNLWDSYEPGTYVRDNGMHAMGYAPMAALGIKLAKPDREVVVVTGDGCMAQVNWVLGTAAEYHIPVKFVVLNNSGLGGGVSAQRGVFGGRFLGTRFEYHMKDEPYSQDFSLLAASYGVESMRVDNPGEVENAVATMLATEGPYVIDFVTALDAVPEGAGRMWISRKGAWGERQEGGPAR